MLLKRFVTLLLITLFGAIAINFTANAAENTGHWISPLPGGLQLKNDGNSIETGLGTAKEAFFQFFPEADKGFRCVGYKQWASNAYAMPVFLECGSRNNNLSCQAHDTIKRYCSTDSLHYCKSGIYRNLSGVCSTGKDYKVNGDVCKSKTRTPNPIDLSTGLKIGRYVDWTSGGSQPFEFVRYYSSRNVYPGGVTASSMGIGWRTNFDARALLFKSGNRSNGTDANIVTILKPDGETLTFRLNNGIWQPVIPKVIINWDYKTVRTDVFDTLTFDGAEFALKAENGQIYAFDLRGRLTTIKQRNGYSQFISYRPEGGMSQVVDSFGRTMVFGVSSGEGGTAKLLQSATLPDGKLLKFKYENYYENANNIGGGGVEIIYDTVSGILPNDPDWSGTSSPTLLNASDNWYLNRTRLKEVVFPDATPASDSDNPRNLFQYANAGDIYHLLAGIVDEKGVQHLTVTYDSDGRATSSERAGGSEKYTVSYDDIANKTTVTNALGRQTVYEFTRQHGSMMRLKAINGIATSACAATNEQFFTDASGAPTRYEDAEGRVTQLTNTAQGLPASVTRSGEATQTIWDAARRLPLVIANANTRTIYAYNADGLLTSTIEEDTSPTAASTRTTTFSYLSLASQSAVAGASAVQLLESVDGPVSGSSDTVNYQYDASGNLTQITNEIGQTTQVTSVNGAGLPLVIVDPNGIVTNLAYNERNWLTDVNVNPGSAQALTSIAYDQVGQITKMTLPDGATLDYVWSDARNLLSVTNNSGEKIEYTYDALRNVTTSTTKYANGTIARKMARAYDELGRLLRTIGASNQTTTYGYDRTDLNTEIIDPRGNLYAFAFDGVQHLIRETNQEGAQVNLTRNGQGDVTSYQDPRAITTSDVRNGFGEVIQEISPDAGTTSFVRDERGLVTQETDGRGVITNMTYDAAGRVLSETYPASPSENVSYTYDDVAAGNKGIGRLTRIADGSGTTEFVYNALGQVLRNTRVIAGQSYVTNYTYTKTGKVTLMTYPSGRAVDVSFNTNRKVMAVTTKAANASTYGTVANPIGWRPVSDLLATMTHGNGLVTGAQYDQDYRLSTLSLKDGAQFVHRFNYAYADGVNLTGIVDVTTAANSNTLTYTPANRLASASGAWGSNSFSYDSVGNRIDDLVTGTVNQSRVASYAATSNRITGMSENGASFRSYAYDGAGNIVTDQRPFELYQYAYNNRNRMSSVTRNGAAYATYIYNALEQLVSRTTADPNGPTGTVHYIYDLDGHLIAEADAANGSITREYIWMPANDNEAQVDLPLAVVEGGALYHVHTDHLGRPIRMTNAAKATVWQASWKPWGEVQSISGTILNNLRFPGQYFQIETGLAYNWHRHYDPVIGRYTQPDPLGFIDGPSVYAYAGNSPFMNVDRMGLNADVSHCPPGLQYPGCKPGILEGGGGGANAGGAVGGAGLGVTLAKIGKEIYNWCVPASTALPTSGRCKPSEEAYCKGWCGRREVMGCYVTIGWRIKGARDLGPIRREQRTVNCNCSDD